MMITKQLGMIPSWQYDTAWPENPKYNNHVVFPPGWNQLTVQPVGPNYGPPEGLGAPAMRGLGISSTTASRLIVGGTILTALAAVGGILLARK